MRFFLFLSLLLLSGCSSLPLLKDQAKENFSDYSYQIGAGDSINIFVWDNPDISTSIVVRPDGKITAPLVEDIIVSGKTPFQIARELEDTYKTYIIDPHVVVIVSNFQGVDAQQIRIVGQIGGGNSSGSNSSGGSGGRYQGRTIPYELGMTLLDVIIRIGSIGEFADGNRASVIREINGVPTRFGVNIDNLIEDADLSENVTMLPGDILLIPEAFF